MRHSWITCMFSHLTLFFSFVLPDFIWPWFCLSPMLLYLAAIHNSLEACWSNTCTRCSCGCKYLDKPDDPVSPSALAINVDPILSKVLHTESLLLHSVSVQQWFNTHSTGNCSLQRQQALITPLLWKSRHLLPPLFISSLFTCPFPPLSTPLGDLFVLRCHLSSASAFLLLFSSPAFFSPPLLLYFTWRRV